MEGCGRAAEFGRFCRGESRNFASWPAEFGKIFRGKLWALFINGVTSHTRPPPLASHPTARPVPAVSADIQGAAWTGTVVHR